MNLINKFLAAFVDECSKISFLRSFSPRLNQVYESRVINSPNGLLFFRGYFSLFFYTKIAFWYYSPKLFTGGIFLNALGLQVARHYVINYFLKPKYINNRFKTLQDDGVQVEKRFLNPNDIEYLLNFYKKNKILKLDYLKDLSELIINSNLPHIKNPTSHKKDFLELYDWLDSKINFARLFKDFSGNDMRSKPYVSILHNKHFHNDSSFTPQADGNARAHRDVFYPSYKIFIYLSDVCEDNAAFTYYPGSHNKNDNSISEIYKNSLKYYSSGSSVNVEQKSNLYNKSFCCEGDAGDAIFFNVQGIHKRGQFKDDQDRERIVLLIDFRQNDALILKHDNVWHK